MDDTVDQGSTRFVFIDDYTRKPVLQLYPAGEVAQPMPSLWKEFLVESQNARDQIGLHTLGSLLSREEYDAINLVSCSRQFPALITSKGALRSKNNALAASRASRSGGVFTSDATAKPDQRQDLLDRAKMCRAKAASWSRQAQLYDDAAEKLEADEKAEADTERA